MDAGKRLAIGAGGIFTPVVTPEGYLTLEDVKRRARALAGNQDASLWDMGDGIACLELTTKDNVITPDVIKIIGEAIKLGTDKRWKGLVIGNDSDTFSAGATEIIAQGGAAGAALDTDKRCDQARTAGHAGAGLRGSRSCRRSPARRGGRLRAFAEQRCHPGACQLLSRPGRAGRRAGSRLGRLRKC